MIVDINEVDFGGLMDRDVIDFGLGDEVLIIKFVNLIFKCVICCGVLDIYFDFGFDDMYVVYWVDGMFDSVVMILCCFIFGVVFCFKVMVNFDIVECCVF